LHTASVTDKCFISYDKSESYNDHPTYDDKIIIYNVLLTKFITTASLSVWVTFRSLTIRVRNLFQASEYTKSQCKK
jgi:hypothetical protein